MENKKTIAQKTIEKAKARGWKTIIGTALNAGAVPLLTMPDLTLKLIGVVCLAAGSALLAWDDGEKQEPIGYTQFKEKELTSLLNNNLRKEKKQ